MIIVELVGFAVLGWGAAALGAGVKETVNAYNDDPEGFKEEVKELAKSAPGMILSAATDTIKNKVESTLENTVSEMDKNRYILDEPQNIYDIVSQLKCSLNHNGYSAEYSDYEQRQIYAALSAAYELEFIHDDFDFFNLMSSDGYNVDQFLGLD